MSDRPARLPSFVREAFEANGPEEEEPELATVLEALPSLLLPARLLRRVSALPLRYAPFYDQLMELWDLPEAAVAGVLTRSADPAAWRKPGLPGIRLIDVAPGPRLAGAQVHLAHFAAGMRYPAHRHLGREALLVLEGFYRDTSGRVVGPGDLHEMHEDSEHSFRIGSERPCVAASIHFGFEFTGPVMRWLVRLFG